MAKEKESLKVLKISGTVSNRIKTILEIKDANIYLSLLRTFSQLLPSWLRDI